MNRPPDVSVPHRAFYSGRRVLVTGGLGFIGSNLARELVDLGADVTIVDALIPDYGGNLFNIDGIADRVHVVVADVRDAEAVTAAVRGQEVIFNLAGQVSHIDSMRDPHTDLEINCHAQLSLLEACRAHNPGVKVVFAGTRQVYGRPSSLPVTEDHLVRPTDVNGINKAAGESYHLVYNNVFGLRACSLRLTNVFGPRQLLKHSRQGFIGWFIRLAIEDQEIQIYGDGAQVRDLVFVDDAADAFLRAGASDDANGRVFNVGGDEPITHRALVERLIDVCGTGRYRFVEWPPEKRAIDIGSFYADSSFIARTLGWRPAVGLRDGLQRTVAFYRANLSQYISRRGAGRRAVIPADDERLPFVDLSPGSDAVEVREAIERVLARGWFILGPEVEAFEAEFAAASGAKHGVGVANGTDAIALALRAAGVNPGDEVIVPAMTAAFTGLAVIAAGAVPVIADVDPRTLTLDARACAEAITPRTRAIVPVHLYGQAADMLEIMAVADRHRLVVIEDCCQAHLGSCNGLPVGTIGAAGAFSFYPTKNLGAFGDGGAVITSDGALADRVRLLRNGGQTNRNLHAVAGVNSRLDELQAAILRVRLTNLLPETTVRRLHAAFYRDALTGEVTPVAERDPGHVYHLFPVQSARREALQAHLARAGVETLIHYPIPLHKQPAFAHLAPRDCPVAARAAAELLSLPLHARLHARQAARVVDAIQAFEKGTIDA